MYLTTTGLNLGQQIADLLKDQPEYVVTSALAIAANMRAEYAMQRTTTEADASENSV